MKGDDIASRLNRRITLQNPVETPDGNGGFTTSWVDVATIWAEVKAVGGREVFAQGQIQARQPCYFRVRYREDVTAAMRISYGGKLFNIRALRDVDGLKRLLEILGEEDVA